MGRALAEARDFGAALVDGVAQLLASAWKARAALLHALAIMLGWALLTAGVARLAPSDVTWLVSGGLFFLSVAGWGHLRMLFVVGLYTLSRKPRR